MKAFCILSVFTLLGTCATEKYSTKIENLKNSIKLVDSTKVVKYANTITSKELSKHLYKFSSDEFQGREVGELGQKLAANFLKDYYINEEIASPYEGSNYYQIIPKSFFFKDIKASENVLAFIKGSEKPEEVIIISAHLDHLGITEDGKVNHGADDDGSGTVAIMEIAQAFNQAKRDGYGPKRSILFLHLTAEEIGKMGSEFYTQHPVFPLKNTIANLNIDMIGRVDQIHENNENYIYLIGSNRLSKELHYISETVNNTYYNINIDYRYNSERDRNQYYSRSDHYNFAKHGIPVIFYFNGEHEDYHKSTDTPDKINYALLQKRARLIFATAWQIANQPNRLATDKENVLLK
ncbi:M28 family peptidase [uncultured Algibacter sp.]|uniref:M28 family peptidase n=1 Tax=uncultured Algibacter sp. TaxID=298659 RepID=UPI002616846D|nr:M28 family peptidase [uncultured Algibacter sp.]